MTTAIVVMVGAGILLVISAIENASIVATFQAIWSGQPISSLAASGASGSNGSNGAQGGTPPGVGNNPSGAPPTNKK